MYALSLQDVAKFKKAVESIKKSFGATDLQSKYQAPQSKMPAPWSSTSPTPAVPLEPELQEVKELVQETLQTETSNPKLPDELEMIQEERGLVIRIAAEDFFGAGEVEPKGDFKHLLNRIGKIVASTHRQVQIEGHSDESESDWDLSAQRAIWLAKHWIQQLKIDPQRISVVGLGHYRPLQSSDASQKSTWARGRNRRVEVVLLSQAEKPDKKTMSKPAH